MRTFKRGIHPAGHKEGSMNEPIREVQPGEELIYPLSQHIGVPATLLVSEGERVLMGQKLAEASAPISASIHSAVSGTVTHIGPHTTMMGELMDAVVVQNDGLYEAVDGFGEEREWRNLNDDEICERVKEAGIVGLGGAGFPTHVKLKPKQPKAIDTLIINGVECEPYLTTDYRLMLEQTEELLTAISIILSLFPHAEAVIAVEDNKPEAIRKLQQATESVERIRVCPLKTKYPQGGERMLIHAVTGRDICSTVLPMDVGCVVENVATVLAIGEAVRYQKPLITRVMTVTGDAVTSPCNVRVSIGDNYRHILEAAGGCKAEPRKIVSGGPMTGIALFDLDIPIIKTSASILALLQDEVEQKKTTSCIHCGRCLHACPEHLVPQMLYRAAAADRFEQFAELHGMECIECGSCTYVCPAKLPLNQSFKYAKKAVADRRRAAKAAATAAEGGKTA